MSLWFLHTYSKGSSQYGHIPSLIRPRGYKTCVHSKTQNKALWLAACGHVSASSQSLRFILRLRLLKFYNLRTSLCWAHISYCCFIHWLIICCLDLIQLFTLLFHGWKFSGLFLNSGFWGWLSKESQPQNAELGRLKWLPWFIFRLSKDY